VADLIRLGEVHSGRLAEQFEAPDVFQADGLEIELGVLDLELGIQIDVSGGVGVGRAGEVGSDRHVTPTTWFDVLGVTKRGQQQESQQANGK
jgi:hypothetical protein